MFVGGVGERVTDYVVVVKVGFCARVEKGYGEVFILVVVVSVDVDEGVG